MPSRQDTSPTPSLPDGVRLPTSGGIGDKVGGFSAFSSQHLDKLLARLDAFLNGTPATSGDGRCGLAIETKTSAGGTPTGDRPTLGDYNPGPGLNPNPNPNPNPQPDPVEHRVELDDWSGGDRGASNLESIIEAMRTERASFYDGPTEGWTDLGIGLAFNSMPDGRGDWHFF